MAGNLFINLTGKLDRPFLDTFPHDVAVTHNLHYHVDKIFTPRNGDFPSVQEFFEPFPFTCELPLPFLPPNKSSPLVANWNDPCMDLVQKKLEWSSKKDIKLKFIRSATRKTAWVGNVEKTMSKGMKKCEIPENCLRYVEHLAQDPDSNFAGSYNWYYSGGCLTQSTRNGSPILFCTRGQENNSLYTIPLKDVLLTEPYLHADATNCFLYEFSKNPIFQLSAVEAQNTNMIGIRQKHTCSLVKHAESDDSLDLIHSNHSEEIFYSIDVYPDGQRYCTASQNRQFTLWDIEASKKIYSQTGEFSSNWCSVQFGDNPNLLLESDRCCVNLLDVRDPQGKVQNIMCKKKLGFLEECEEISLTVKSSVANFCYVGTHHLMLLMDSRSPQKPYIRWTHMLQSVPTYGCVTRSENKEFLCISSQKPEEIEIIINKWSSDPSSSDSSNSCDFPVSKTLPFMIPSMKDTTDFARKHGSWLDPNIQHRTSLSLIGSTCVVPDFCARNPVLVFTETSAGDLFCSRLLERRRNATSELCVSSYCMDPVWGHERQGPAFKKFSRWGRKASKIMQKEVPTFKVSTILNGVNLMKIVNNEVLEGRDYQKERRIARMRQWRISKKAKNEDSDSDSDKWQISEEDMNEYTDFIATKVLEHWKEPTKVEKSVNGTVSSEPSNDEPSETNLNSTKSPKKPKLDEWFRLRPFNAHKENSSTNNSSYCPSDVDLFESQSACASQSRSVVCNSLSVSSSQKRVVNTPRLQRLRSNHVAGF